MKLMVSAILIVVVRGCQAVDKDVCSELAKAGGLVACEARHWGVYSVRARGIAKFAGLHVGNCVGKAK